MDRWNNNNNNNNNNNTRVGTESKQSSHLIKRSTSTDTILFIKSKKITALVIDIAVPLTHNIPKTEAEKIPIYENLALEIKNI
jgi:hypothetical protein